MSLRLFILLLFCSAAGLKAQTNVVSIPNSPAATPSASTDPTQPDGSKYSTMHGKLDGVKAQVAAFQAKSCDVMFIGDSITAGWLGAGKKVWDQFYGKRNAMDFGVGGDTTQNVLWRMENLDISKQTPKVAVIMIGTNNIKNTPEEIAAGVKAVVTETEQMFPSAKIILLSITPNQRAGEKMTAADAIIKGLDDQKTVFYLDLVPLMPPIVTTKPDGKTDTNWKGMKPDHLHPDEHGYQIWADAMEPLLKKLLGEP